jgi:hypothetical protein
MSKHKIIFAASVLILAAGCESDPTAAELTRSIEIVLSEDSVDVGDTLSLVASAKDASDAPVGDAQIEWSSSDPGVLEVVDGMAIGRAAGTVFVRASFGQVSDSVHVTVEPHVATLEVWPADTVRIIQGREARLILEMFDPEGEAVTHSVRIESTRPSAVGVDALTLKGIELGTAEVAISAGKGTSRQIHVEVVNGASFNYRSLGTFEPRALNNRGWIAGIVDGHAALWRRGVAERLPIEGVSASAALVLNDSGMVAGIGTPEDGSAPFVWTWRNGSVRRIPLDDFPGPEGPLQVVTTDINSRGEIVGNAAPVGAYREGYRFFHWDGTRLEWLPAGWNIAGINDAGVMVGDSSVTDGIARAIPRPTESSDFWTATDINETGRYIGLFQQGATLCTFTGEGDQVLETQFAMVPSGLNRYGDYTGSYAGPVSSSGPTVVVREGKSLQMEPPDAAGYVSYDLNDLGQVIIARRTPEYRYWLASPSN